MKYEIEKWRNIIKSHQLLSGKSTTVTYLGTLKYGHIRLCMNKSQKMCRYCLLIVVQAARIKIAKGLIESLIVELKALQQIPNSLKFI